MKISSAVPHKSHANRLAAGGALRVVMNANKMLKCSKLNQNRA